MPKRTIIELLSEVIDLLSQIESALQGQIIFHDNTLVIPMDPEDIKSIKCILHKAQEIDALLKEAWSEESLQETEKPCSTDYDSVDEHISPYLW